MLEDGAQPLGQEKNQCTYAEASRAAHPYLSRNRTELWNHTVNQAAATVVLYILKLPNKEKFQSLGQKRQTWQKDCNF